MAGVWRAAHYYGAAADWLPELVVDELGRTGVEHKTSRRGWVGTAPWSASIADQETPGQRNRDSLKG